MPYQRLRRLWMATIGPRRYLQVVNFNVKMIQSLGVRENAFGLTQKWARIACSDSRSVFLERGFYELISNASIFLCDFVFLGRTTSNFKLNWPVARLRLLTFAKSSVRAMGFSAVLLRAPEPIVTGSEIACAAASDRAFQRLFYGEHANVDEQ
jgi:hypothetical protein